MYTSKGKDSPSNTDLIFFLGIRVTVCYALFPITIVDNNWDSLGRLTKFIENVFLFISYP